MTRRISRVALLVLVAGLALHNLAMALLWQAGVRNTALDVAAAWKEALLVVAFVAAVAAVGSVPRLFWADRLALAYGALVVLYWLLPQSWLGGEASRTGYWWFAPLTDIWDTADVSRLRLVDGGNAIAWLHDDGREAFRIEADEVWKLREEGDRPG